MKSPAGKTPSTAASKAKPAPKGKTAPYKAPTAASYTAASRRQAGYARQETGSAAKARAEAAKAAQAAKAELKAGNRAAGARDQARSRRDSVRAGRESARARGDIARSRADAAKARTVGLTLPGAVAGAWILGGNDWHRGCAAVAVANSLLAAAGVRASGEDVLSLHLAVSGTPDTGASIPAVLGTVADAGLGGMFPLSFRALEPGEPLDEDGLILDLALREAQQDQDVWDSGPSPLWGAHAGVLVDGSVITWGRAVPVTAEFLDWQVRAAWRIRWAVS